jgi:putative sterol carrier protein
MVMLMKFPTYMAGNQREMEQQLQQQMRTQQQQGLDIEDTKVVKYTIRGQEVPVTEGVGTDADTGAGARQYMAMIPGETGPLMVMVITQDPPAEAAPEMDDGPARLSAEEVRSMLESIK